MILKIFGNKNKKNKMRILLVDDSWAAILFMKRILNRYFKDINFFEYEIVECESYTAYLERGDGHFDLAFVDWNLSNNRQENGEVIALDLKVKRCPVVAIFSGMEDDSAIISTFTMKHLFFYVHKGEVDQLSKLHTIASKGIESWKSH